MINTRSKEVSAQFRQRSVALAREVGVKAYDEEAARDAWKKRCGVSHGGPFLCMDDAMAADTLQAYEVLESVLRLSVRRAIEDPLFREVFDNKQRINKEWPVPAGAKA